MTIDELRAFCLGLPGTHEKETWGDAEHAGDVTFRVKDKIYLITGQEGGSASIRTDKAQQTDLIAAFPDAVSVSAVRRSIRVGERATRRTRSRHPRGSHPDGVAPDRAQGVVAAAEASSR
jgi:hypothetical protein